MERINENSGSNWGNGATCLVQYSESVGNVISSISSCKAQAKENAYIQKFLFLSETLSETTSKAQAFKSE